MTASTGCTGALSGGGGGGGGYYGGGGGGSAAATVNFATGGSGGGGSSYASPAGTGTAFSPSPVGTFDASGQVTISYEVPDLAFTTTSPLPDATQNAPYSTTLQTTGGTGNPTFAVTGGALPPGLTLNPATGAITGTPTTTGSFHLHRDGHRPRPRRPGGRTGVHPHGPCRRSADLCHRHGDHHRQQPQQCPRSAPPAMTSSSASAATTNRRPRRQRHHLCGGDRAATASSAATATTASRARTAPTPSPAATATTPSSAATAFDVLYGGPGTNTNDGGPGLNVCVRPLTGPGCTL